MKKKSIDKVKTLTGENYSFSQKTVKTNYSKFPHRARLRNLGARNNDGTFKNSQTYIMFRVWNSQTIFTPRRHKLKGYEKEARRNNHHRKAA